LEENLQTLLLDELPPFHSLKYSSYLFLISDTYFVSFNAIHHDIIHGNAMWERSFGVMNSFSFFHLP